jgi:hypothetical protein
LIRRVKGVIRVESVISLLGDMREQAQNEQERLAHEDNVGDKWMALEKYESAIQRAIIELKKVAKA